MIRKVDAIIQGIITGIIVWPALSLIVGLGLAELAEIEGSWTIYFLSFFAIPILLPGSMYHNICENLNEVES